MMLKKKIWPWVLYLAYVSMVLYLCFGKFSSIPNVQSSYFGIPTDKCVHFIMFAPFTVLTYLCLNIKKGGFGKTLLVALCLIILGALLGAACEWGQSLTTYRSGDVKDLIADALGLLSGALFVVIIDRIRK